MAGRRSTASTLGVSLAAHRQCRHGIGPGGHFDPPSKSNLFDHPEVYSLTADGITQDLERNHERCAAVHSTPTSTRTRSTADLSSGPRLLASGYQAVNPRVEIAHHRL